MFLLNGKERKKKKLLLMRHKKTCKMLDVPIFQETVPLQTSNERNETTPFSIYSCNFLLPLSIAVVVFNTAARPFLKKRETDHNHHSFLSIARLAPKPTKTSLQNKHCRKANICLWSTLSNSLSVWMSVLMYLVVYYVCITCICIFVYVCYPLLERVYWHVL